MIRIGIDAKRAFKNFSGLGNYSRSLISGLSHLYPYNEYTLYTPEYDSEDSRLNFCKRDNINIVTPEGIYSKLPSFIWRSSGIVSNINRDKLDLFHGLSGELPSSKFSTPKVVTLHDVICLRNPEYFTLIDRKIYERKFAYACKAADKIIAISKQTADDIIRYLNADPKKIEIVYQGCDTIFHTQPTKEQLISARMKYNLPDKFIVNVGTIERRKNLVSVIKALKEIPSDVKLVVLGKPTDYMNDVNIAIKELGLEKRVIFIHNASFTDFPAIYKQAVAATYVSLFEGFGIPVLEGLTVGVPVITSNLSSMPEAGGDAALYVDPLDASQIASNINMLLSSPTIVDQIIEKGYMHAKEFREENVMANINSVYSQLLKY